MSEDPSDKVKEAFAKAEDVSLPPEMTGQPAPNVAQLDDFRNRTTRAHVFQPNAGGRKSRFFTGDSLDGQAIPPREWLVRDLVPTKTVTMLSGDGGTGKSLVALQLAVACALGKSWIGRSVNSGRALFLSAEDDTEELHRRLADIVKAEGETLADLDNLSLRSLAGEDALLSVLDARSGALRPTDLYHELDDFLTKLNPVVLVLDTLADLFPGNENDRAQARQFIGLLRGLAIRHECAVVLLAHPSLSGLQSGAGTSGSTGWSNSVRSRLYLRRVLQGDEEPNPDARILSTMKANYAATGNEIGLTWFDGVFMPDEAETGLDRRSKRDRATRVFLKLLRLFTEQKRRVNSGGGMNYAPAVFADHPDSEGVSRAALRDAMERLLASGTVQNVETGRESKRRSHLEEVQK